MFGERWNRILTAHGDQTALWLPRGSWTFRQLNAEAEKLKPQSCPSIGLFYLAQGDGFAIALAVLAAFLTGRPVQVVEADRLRRMPKRRPPRQTALIKQTVGSSGHRRCQFFSFEQITADVDRLHATLSLQRCGVAVAAISGAHSYGLTTTILQMLLHGLPVHWLPTPFPSGLSEAAASHGRIFLPAVPAIWKAWLAAGLALPRDTLAVSAGSPLSTSLESQAREKLGLKLHTLYGASECGAIAYDDSPEPRRSGMSLGRLLPGVAATAGRHGRLLVTSDAVGIGYDETLNGDHFGRGQHLTWDEVGFTAAGLEYVNCLGAGINVAGRKLSPDEIADRIRAATGVRHVRIQGAPSRDPERVQDIVVSLRVPAAELTPEFKARACASLAPWEVPRRWRAEPEAETAPNETLHNGGRQERPALDVLRDGALPAV